MKIRKSIKEYNLILIIFLILSSTILFNNKKIEIETKNNIKALDQEGQNYRLVTSADNVQVPVPKGYVASQITGENYVTPQYSHTTNTYKVSSTPTELTWSSPAGETYPWTQDSNGIWISGNQGIPNSKSTLESEEFDYIQGTTLTINYTYSSAGYDYLNIYIIKLSSNTENIIVTNKYGNTSDTFDYTTSNYSYTIKDWVTGRYKIRVTYSKNSTIDEGQDSVYIKPSTFFKDDENGTQTIEEDIKTKIHNGGFVIYQLTDEEIETNPNGTSVIINDNNKETAQSTRNQYVWVPVPNIEDIMRTKIDNNGIMQFGQEYIFTSKSITKNTYTQTQYYSEPLIVNYYDKTKYYLQRYSNIDKRENYLNKLQEDYTNTIKSINKYKGFYIARYETGYNVNPKGNPQIVRYNEKICTITWYDSYKNLERLSGKTGEYVETGMIYDSLWSYTLKWLNDTDTRSCYEIHEDSGTWGNYSNNKKTTTSGRPYPAKTGAIETITYKGETYSDSPTASNNIFDIAGNVYEWTVSSSGSDRRLRGGDYSINNSITCSAYNNFSYFPYDYRNTYGSRGMLIIM